MKDYNTYEEWLDDFDSGYLYDPDGTQVKHDSNITFQDYLKEIDETLDKIEFLPPEEVEKLVSRLIQFRNHVQDETNLRFMKVLLYLGQRG